MRKGAPLTAVDVFYRDGGGFSFTTPATVEEVVDGIKDRESNLIGFKTQDDGVVVINTKLMTHLEVRREVKPNE